MEQAELGRTIAQAMRRLPSRYREVMRTCDVDDMDYECAARKIGIPLGTVRSRLSKARRMLRENAMLCSLG